MFETKCGKSEMVVSGVRHSSRATIAFTTCRFLRRHNNTFAKEGILSKRASKIILKNRAVKVSETRNPER